MEKLLKHIVSHVVENPEAITITQEEKEQAVYLNLKVDPTDLPRVIGKKGKIIQALRQLVKIRSLLTKKNTILILEE